MQDCIDQASNNANQERWRSIVVLTKPGKPAFRDLLTALQDNDKWVRYAAVDALGDTGDLRCVDHLITTLHDQDRDVRFITAEALGKLGDPKARRALHHLSASEKGYVRIAAKAALTKLPVTNGRRPGKTFHSIFN